MEKEIDYKKLYELQDKALDLIFSCNNDFYLTGGTALHRFYYNLRYSNDLDLFSCSNALFHENIKEILIKFEEQHIQYDYQTRTKDFLRIYANDFLQIDFVNDRSYREGKSNIIKGMRIDNIMNILANKMCTIIDRDEEKDIFDLFAICSNEAFNWGNALEISRKKQDFDKSFLVERIKAFPLYWLDKLKIIKKSMITKELISKLLEDIMLERENTLKKG